MNITFSIKNDQPRFEISAYAIPSHWRLSCWKQKSGKYVGGFVVRFLCFGFVFRYGNKEAQERYEYQMNAAESYYSWND